MNKELTPLEAFNEFLNIIDVPVKSHLLNFNDAQTLERYRVLRTQIEDSLKEGEEAKKKNQIIRTRFGELDNKCCALILEKQANEKEHKALEIIKEKEVDVFWFTTCLTLFYPVFNDDEEEIVLYHDAREKYNNETNGHELTQEEFNLLKEILLCQQ